MASQQFSLEIVTPDGIIYNDEIDELSIPTINGEITILPHHIALYAKLAEGEARIKKNGKENLFAVLGGVVEVGGNKVSILSDYAVHADSIVIAHAEEAKKRAEDAMRDKKSTAEYTLEDRDLRKSILELKIAHKMKKSQTHTSR